MGDNYEKEHKDTLLTDKQLEEEIEKLREKKIILEKETSRLQEDLIRQLLLLLKGK